MKFLFYSLSSESFEKKVKVYKNQQFIFGPIHYILMNTLP